MAPKANHEQITIRFDKTVPEQARALAIYEELLQSHQSAKTLGTLFPVVLTVLADVARDHPALNNRQARLVAKYQDQVMALIQRLEAGESIPDLGSPAVSAEPPPSRPPKPEQPATAAPSDIEIDLSILE